MGRLLIIDESLDKRLCRELQARGRDAQSHTRVQQGGEWVKFSGLVDPDVLEVLSRLDRQDWVLVTADDALPWEHEASLARMEATVATVDGDWEAACARRGLNWNQEMFKRDTVHRWAHVMADQAPGSIYRYSPFAKVSWRPKKKHERLPKSP